MDPIAHIKEALNCGEVVIECLNCCGSFTDENPELVTNCGHGTGTHKQCAEDIFIFQTNKYETPECLVCLQVLSDDFIKNNLPDCWGRIKRMNEIHTYSYLKGGFYKTDDDGKKIAIIVPDTDPSKQTVFPCPACFEPFFKSHGCSHLTCKKCCYEFYDYNGQPYGRAEEGEHKYIKYWEEWEDGRQMSQAKFHHANY